MHIIVCTKHPEFHTQEHSLGLQNQRQIMLDNVPPHSIKIFFLIRVQYRVVVNSK